ncbi:LA_3751/LA_3752 family putative glycosyltransferase [Leptospira terpstrae]|uniref:LA_3751/LA_3752 family putative glycosyltransferase n=1 Tax=Leptospira terpstrae TaxID=293075 RepID=UPI003D0682AB
MSKGRSKFKNWSIWILFIFAVFYSIEFTQPQFSLFQDSHDKAVQTFSIWQNHFVSDNLYYPAKEFDSNLDYFHLTQNLFLKDQEKLVSAFPIQFAFLMAPFLSLFPIHFLPYTSLLFLGLGFLVLRKIFHFSFLLLGITFFATFLWPLSWEYSELPAIFVFFIYGLHPFLRKKNTTFHLFLSGIALGWVIVVRLDTLPFFSIFFLSYFFLYLRKSPKEKFQKFIQFYFVFFISLLVFLLVQLSLNHFLYGHFLGTRYLANANGFSAGFTERLQWFKSLLFFSNLKIGFFGYLPFSLILLIIYWYKFKKISDSKKALLLATTGTLFIIPWIAPNDGFNNWGPRFYTILIFPYLYFLKPLVSYYYQKKKIIFYSFLLTFGVFTFFLGIVGAKIQKSKTNLEKKFAPILSELNPDILVFQDFLNLYTSGTYYFGHVVIVSYSSESNQKLLNRISFAYPNRKVMFVSWNPDLISKEMKEAINNDKRMSGFPISEWNTAQLEKQMQLLTNDFKIIDRNNYRFWIGTLKSEAK